MDVPDRQVFDATLPDGRDGATIIVRDVWTENEDHAAWLVATKVGCHSSESPSGPVALRRRSVVGEHADHDAIRIANEEAADAPRLVDRVVDDLMSGLDCFGMRRIDGFS